MHISENPVTEERVLTPARRTFLKAGLAVGAVALVDSWMEIDETQSTQGAETPDKELISTYNPTVNPLEKFDDHLIENNTLPDTVKDTLPVIGSQIGYSLLANNNVVRLWSGNSGTEEIVERYQNNKLKILRTIVVTAPVVEEVAFRALPAIGGGTEKMMPIRGIVSTYLFGKVHQIRAKKGEETLLDPKPKPEFSIDQNRVPVPQYAIGGFLWMLA